MILTEIGLVLFFFWNITALTCFIYTKDIASPLMLTIAGVGVYFSDIFISYYRFEIVTIYVLILLSIILICFMCYSKKGNQNQENSAYGIVKTNHLKFSTVLLWLISIPSIIAQVYLVLKFGGFDGYIPAAKMGTKYFHGLGPLKTIISTYFPISLFYFAMLICSKPKKLDISIFILHFLIFILIAVLTLSRGTLLTQFVFMILIWHFLKQKIQPIFIGTSLLFLLIVASIYGTIRESVTYKEGSLNLNWGKKCENCEWNYGKEKYKTEWSYAGLFPLKKLLDAKKIKKQYGATYITILTNFVPRAIWANKPSPGGVVFTNHYAQGYYEPYSHFATGIIPEAIINFGYEFGLIFALLQFWIIIIILSRLHIKKFLNRQNLSLNINKVRNTIIFVYVIHAVGHIFIAEITSLVIGILIKVFVIYVVSILLRLKFYPKSYKST